MRILFLTQYFPPEMGAPQVRLSELGERLIDRGWQAEALTALPNYPTGKIIGDYSPWRCVEETVGRIRTVRVPLYPAKTGFIKRLFSYFSFVLSASWYGPKRCQRPDVMLVESPPLFIGYAARYLAWRWKCPYVFNVSDLWPESAIRMGVLQPGMAARMAERLELSLYRNAAAITGQSEEIIAAIRKRAPETPNEVITNGVAPERFGKQAVDGDVRDLLGDEPGPVFTYAGLLGLAQGLDQLLDIAQQWPADMPGRFLMVGDGPAREVLERRIREEGITRARIVGPQPRERVPALLAASDVAFISLGMSIPGAVPSKIYEAMASSLPILLIADGEPARRVERAGCGLVVSPGNVAAARDACLRLAQDYELRKSLGESGRIAAETDYNRQRIADRLDGFLTRVVENTPAAAK
ncbi:MAG: glycosyltransferase family 4 protein [Pirellulales bacterium]|nr:glycosyltransferase family 4 protein [Pirellulales bacterium]